MLSILAFLDGQYLSTALMSVVGILYAYFRSRIVKGKNILGRSVGVVVDDAPRWVIYQYSKIRTRFTKKKEEPSLLNKARKNLALVFSLSFALLFLIALAIRFLR